MEHNDVALGFMSLPVYGLLSNINSRENGIGSFSLDYFRLRILNKWLVGLFVFFCVGVSSFLTFGNCPGKNWCILALR
jgi:hypothetical protein